MSEAHVENWQPVVNRLQMPAFLVGVVGLAICLVGLLFGVDSRAAVARSYLWAYMFWFGVPMGCLAILMLQHLTGGRWALAIRRILESGTRMILLMAVLFLPLLLSMNILYPWTHKGETEQSETASVAAHAENHADPAIPAAESEHHEITGFKRAWLSTPAFVLRAVIYFCIWLGLAWLLNMWSLREDRTGDPRATYRMQVISGPGIVIYALTVTGAAVDWVMSLDPHWFSTMYGVIFMVGQGLSCFAFVVAVIALLSDRVPFVGLLDPILLNDLGNFLLAFVMLFAYVSFSQYLIIWSGNIAEETPYFFIRTKGGWQYLALLIVAFHFLVPFLLLLWRKSKRNIRSLAAIAIGLIVMRWVDLFWVIAPTFIQGQIDTTQKPIYVPSIWRGFHWMTLPALAGIGGLWIAVFIWQLKRRPLLPLNDLRLAEVNAHGH